MELGSEGLNIKSPIISSHSAKTGQNTAKGSLSAQTKVPSQPEIKPLIQSPDPIVISTTSGGQFGGGNYSPMLFQPPLKKALSYPEQVEQMSTVAKEQNKIRQEEVQALLKWVTEGHLVEVETLLKKNPSLGVCTGTIKDLSDRTFKNITALQYAAWSLDREMCNVIMGYVGTHNSAIQLKALYDEPKHYSDYGTHYDIKPLIEKTQKYVENCDKWWKENQAECYRYWQKEVGGEQRKCPAWLVYAWSEEGYDVAWTKQDFSRKVKREYDKNRLDWWFTENYNEGGGVGSCWGVFRGMGGSIRRLVSCLGYIVHDVVSQQLLEKYGKEQLTKLQAKMTAELKEDSVTVRKKQ